MSRKKSNNLLFEENRHKYWNTYIYNVIAFISLLSVLIIGVVYVFFNPHVFDGDGGGFTHEITIFVVFIVAIIGILIKSTEVIGRKQYRLFTNGFVPPFVPRKRRHPKPKRYIAVREIEELTAHIFKKGRYERNYINVKLKEGIEFEVFEGDATKKGFDELLKFKEHHNIPGEEHHYYNGLHPK